MQVLPVGSPEDPILQVRAGEVQLEKVRLARGLDPGGQVQPLVVGVAGDAHHHRRPQGPQPRQLLGQKLLDPFGGDADGVEHPAGGLPDPGRGVARPRVPEDGLVDHRPELGGWEEPLVDVGDLVGAGGGHDGVGQGDPADLHGQLDSCTAAGTASGFPAGVAGAWATHSITT